MHIGAEEVLEQEQKYLPKHMGGAASPFFETRNDTQHPLLGKTQEAKTRRKQYQRNPTDLLTARDRLPDPFIPIFEQSKVKLSSITGRPITDLTEDIFTTEIDKGAWRDYIASKKKNTSPGFSGIRIDHIAAAPPKMAEAIRKLLSLPYLSGIKYRQWENEIITWLPKEEDNPDIARRRPITLLEVMKKVHIGVKKNEFISIALKHKMISDDHHGALAGRSTTKPLMKKILAL